MQPIGASHRVIDSASNIENKSTKQRIDFILQLPCENARVVSLSIIVSLFFRMTRTKKMRNGEEEMALTSYSVTIYSEENFLGGMIVLRTRE